MADEWATRMERFNANALKQATILAALKESTDSLSRKCEIMKTAFSHLLKEKEIDNAAASLDQQSEKPQANTKVSEKVGPACRLMMKVDVLSQPGEHFAPIAPQMLRGKGGIMDEYNMFDNLSLPGNSIVPSLNAIHESFPSLGCRQEYLNTNRRELTCRMIGFRNVSDMLSENYHENEYHTCICESVAVNNCPLTFSVNLGCSNACPVIFNRVAKLHKKKDDILPYKIWNPGVKGLGKSTAIRLLRCIKKRGESMENVRKDTNLDAILSGNEEVVDDELPNSEHHATNDYCRFNVVKKGNENASFADFLNLDSLVLGLELSDDPCFLVFRDGGIDILSMTELISNHLCQCLYLDFLSLGEIKFLSLCFTTMMRQHHFSSFDRTRLIEIDGDEIIREWEFEERYKPYERGKKKQLLPDSTWHDFDEISLHYSLEVYHFAVRVWKLLAVLCFRVRNLEDKAFNIRITQIVFNKEGATENVLSSWDPGGVTPQCLLLSMYFETHGSITINTILGRTRQSGKCFYELHFNKAQGENKVWDVGGEFTCNFSEMVITTIPRNSFIIIIPCPDLNNSNSLVTEVWSVELMVFLCSARIWDPGGCNIEVLLAVRENMICN